MDGRRGISAVSAKDVRADRLLVTYDKTESRFQYSPPDGGDPTLIAFHGELILRPDVASAFEGRPNSRSQDEVYFEGDTPLVAVHIQRAVEFRLLNLSTGVIESSHAGQMIGFRKWSICVRESRGGLFAIMEFKPTGA
jgi:hypothetical protein